MFVYKNKHLSSFFFSILSTRAPLGLQGPLGAGVSRKSAHIYSNTSMQKVKTNPYRYNSKCWHPK